MHTRGPWETKPARIGRDVAIVAAGKFIVAEAFEDIREAGEQSPEVTANARLIAAAPDMLEALKAMLPFVHGLMEHEIKKVIAKAEGVL